MTILAGKRKGYEVPDGLADPIDQALYDAAMRRFRADAALHAASARLRAERSSGAPMKSMYWRHVSDILSRELREPR